MRRALWLACVLTACSVQPFPPNAHGQSPRFAVMDDYVRERLAKDWDAHATDAILLERAYCVRFQRDFFAGESAWRITQIATPDSIEATPHSIGFVCPREPDVATIHVHPSASCDELGCYPGGLYSYQCFASDQDRAFLAWRGDRFLMVQCDRNAVVVEWPRRR